VRADALLVMDEECRRNCDKGRCDMGLMSRRTGAAVLLALTMSAAGVPALAAGPPPAAGAAAATNAGSARVEVVVRARPGQLAAAEAAVRAAGGQVTRRLAVLDTLTAQLPAGSVARLRSAPGVHAVTGNRAVRLHTSDPGGSALRKVAQELEAASEMWIRGWTGGGIDVAVIDSGVVPVNGLRTANKVVHGPDLSFESQDQELRHQDTYGHGTHMSGIIAGRDDRMPGTLEEARSTFVGVAPGARIVSVKVADASGATDVTQVLAAIDWVIANRRAGGLNIRVLNLSFGTDSVQDYRLDPLSYAAEVAWRHGIVVVAAAGNRGTGSGRLTDPAYNPFVLAVGAADGHGTHDVNDDTIPAFSSHGDGVRNPDLVAPGTSVVSLRSPGSRLDTEHPEGRVAERFFRGSGTSQAAAVVSGAIALLLEARPNLTPDQVKLLVMSSIRRLPAADPKAQGTGMIDLKLIQRFPTPTVVASRQLFTPATGLGSLDAARGSVDLVDGTDGTVLAGEYDIFGTAWTPGTWTVASAAGTAFTNGTWNGTRWAGTAWSGTRWAGTTWAGTRWAGTRWAGDDWSAATWTGTRWAGTRWAGTRWAGSTWSGTRWAGAAYG
jgi:hypothetical protein